jgi:hypothetical protein
MSWTVGELVDLERRHEREVQGAEDMLDVGVDGVEILENGIFESAAPMLVQSYRCVQAGKVHSRHVVLLKQRLDRALVDDTLEILLRTPSTRRTGVLHDTLDLHDEPL